MTMKHLADDVWANVSANKEHLVTVRLFGVANDPVLCRIDSDSAVEAARILQNAKVRERTAVDAAHTALWAAARLSVVAGCDDNRSVDSMREVLKVVRSAIADSEARR